jgi:hypothetical protein
MGIHRIFNVSLFLSVMILGCNKETGTETEEEKSNPQSLGRTVKTAVELPACTGDLLSQLFWVEDIQAFKLCNGEQFVEVSIKGATGAEGKEGPAGPAGPKGSAANSGVWVFDANGKVVGLQLSKLVLLSNEGLMNINFSTGAYLDTAALNSTTGQIEEHEAFCSFTSVDCSGQCYQEAQIDGFLDNLTPLRNAVYFTGTSYFIATGSETAVPVSLQSNYRNGACTTTGGGNSGYPITKIYSLPSDVTLPIPLPMYFGLKTE